MELLRLLRADWRKNYRFHGGLPTLVRCWRGDRRLRRGVALPEPVTLPRLDCVVFSVLPKMSALWVVLFERAIGLRPLRVILGDCSGGLSHAVQPTQSCFVVPMLNPHHGEKLDLAFAHLCRTDVVLVTDDDIFWLDEEPLRWALARLDADERLAVVGLVPKRTLSSVLQGKVERAMGSVLVVRRSLWEQEGLSFRIVRPPASEGFDSIYDTGEFSQVELGRRGYRVELGPPELKRHFASFTAVSNWTLKLQSAGGDLSSLVEGIPIRQEMALRTVFVLRGLAELLDELTAGIDPHLVAPATLDRAERYLGQLLGGEEVMTIRQSIEENLTRLRKLVRALDKVEPLREDLRRILGVAGA